MINSLRWRLSEWIDRISDLIRPEPEPEPEIDPHLEKIKTRVVDYWDRQFKKFLDADHPLDPPRQHP